jgi:ATPase subunit of ABC transporter with duplicated ATPase domains
MWWATSRISSSTKDRSARRCGRLSGGEKARLLLARIMARQSNLLVLDEPTNDLDVETLDLLQETLAGYDGTVLLVSHDRDFLDRVATVTVALEGGGKAVVYAGGWSDMQAQRQARGEADGTEAEARRNRAKADGPSKAQASAENRAFLHRDAPPRGAARRDRAAGGRDRETGGVPLGPGGLHHRACQGREGQRARWRSVRPSSTRPRKNG